MKRVWRIVFTAFLLLATPFGCGDEDKSVAVKYEIKDGVLRCFNTCDQSEFTSGDYHTVTCVWCCAKYKGRKEVYVSITWKAVDGAWVISNEYISSGICGSKKSGVTKP